MTSLNLSASLVMLVLLGDDACRAQVPPGLEEPKLMRNGFSGDLRIQIRSFHAITLFDTSSFGRDATDGRQQLEVVLRSFSRDLTRKADGVVDASRPFFDVVRRPHRLEGTNATWEKLDGLLRTLADPVNEYGVKAGDVVFFWSLTHGDVGADGKRVLILDGTPRSRDALRKQMEFPVGGKRRTHLTVFITEEIREPNTGPRTPGRPCGEETRTGAGRASSGFKSLLYGHQGTVDIEAPTVLLNGESVFTVAFRKTFDELLVGGAGLGRSDSDGFVEWNGRFFPRIQYNFKTVVRTILARHFVADATGKLQLDTSGTPRPTAEFRALALEDQSAYRRLATLVENGSLTPSLNTSLRVEINRARAQDNLGPRHTDTP
jgi:hypothetical protein